MGNCVTLVIFLATAGSAPAPQRAQYSQGRRLGGETPDATRCRARQPNDMPIAALSGGLPTQ
jgi:hypothetical protein